MFKQFLLTSAASVLLLFSLNSFAAKIADKGVYLEANAGYAKVNETVEFATDNKNTGFGWNVNLGYKFTPYLAAELGFYGYPNEDFTIYDYSLAKGKNNYAVAVAGKGIVPLGDYVSLFAKLGVGLANHELQNEYLKYVNAGSHSGAVALVGAGMAFALTDNLAFVAQGSATSKSSDNIPPMYLGTLGLSYTFNI